MNSVMDRLYLELANVVSPETKSARELALEAEVSRLNREVAFKTEELGKYILRAADADEALASAHQQHAKAEEEIVRLRGALDESDKIIRAYEDARHEWGSQRNVEAIAKLLWHRFAPAHHIGWEDEPRKAEYRLAASDALLAALKGEKA